MYLSFCQPLPYSNSSTEPAGYCRWKDAQFSGRGEASVCAIVDGKLNNQTSTFGIYQPQQVPFKAIGAGMFAFLVHSHTTVLI